LGSYPAEELLHGHGKRVAILIGLSAIGVALHLIVQGLRRSLIFWLDTRTTHQLETSGS